MPGNLLFIEDDSLVRRSLANRLRAAGHRVREAGTLSAAKAVFAAERYDVVLLDYRLPDGTGFDLMDDMAVELPNVPVVMLTAHGTVDHAVEAMRRGAYTYVQKPVEADELNAHITRAMEVTVQRRETAQSGRRMESGRGADAFLGTSPGATALREQIRRIAGSPVRAVLLEGESGAGKGLVARAIHEESERAAKPFVSITCSAIPEPLLESELFGHESGAFTDARKRKMGLVEAAEGGTLFLDEIGDMAPPLQAKVLGILEDHRFRRVGGLQEIESDVRVISATHRDLRAYVKDGRFREDLLFRLRVVPLRIPPLRDRLEDIPLLAEHFVRQLAVGWGRPALKLPGEALDVLARRPWPGNVRELRNAVERAVILATGPDLEASSFREDSPAAQPPDDDASDPVLPCGGIKIEEWTDALVRKALRRSQGNQSAAARLLGMSRDQIRYRMQRLGLLKGPSAA